MIAVLRLAGITILAALILAATTLTLIALPALIWSGHWVLAILVAWVGFCIALFWLDRIRR